MTGVHALHVAIGVVAFAMIAWFGARGRLARGHVNPVENTALYWHFVDAVWIVVFTSLYLSPRWL
jgi:heme/copper-type cytochrome/quinol oxidase subunit 3